MNGVEEMSINEKENTESVNKETDNDIRRQPIFQQYESGVRLALALAEFDIAHVSLKPATEVDIYKQVLDAIAKARNNPIPVNRITAVLPNQNAMFPGFASVTVCHALAIIAIDMVSDMLAEESDNNIPEQSRNRVQWWKCYSAAKQSQIVACLNSMIFGYDYIRCATSYSLLTEVVRALCPNPQGANTLIRMVEGQYNLQQYCKPAGTMQNFFKPTETDKQ